MKTKILVVGTLAAALTSTLVSAGYELSIERDMGYKLANGTLSKAGTTGWDYGFPVNTEAKYFETIIDSGVTGFWPEQTFAVVSTNDNTSYIQGKGMPYNIQNLVELPFNVADFASDGERAYFLTDSGELHYTLPQYETWKGRYENAIDGPGRDIVGNIVSLEASAFNIGLLNDEGTLYTYGENRNGVNGNMTGSNRFTPVDNITAPVISYSSDSGTWVALDMNGTVWGWGGNSACMLTDAVTCNAVTLTPQVIGYFPGATKVQVSTAATYVLDGNGDLYIAGTVGLFSMSTRTAMDWLKINKAIKQYNNSVTDIIAESSVVYAKSGDCWYGKGSYHAGVGDITNIRATGEFFEVECDISKYDAGIVPLPVELSAELPAKEVLVCPIEDPVVEIEYVEVEVPVIEYVEVEVPYEVVVTVTEYIDVPVEVIKEVVVTKTVEVPVEVIKEVVVTDTVIKYVEVAVPVTPNYTIKELKKLLKEKRTERKEARKQKNKDNNGHGNGDEHGGDGKYDTTNPGNGKKK